jgi:hypothetical protein
LSRASKTDYGIATDGLQWIILKFDAASAQSKEFFEVNLKPVFSKIHNPEIFTSQEEVEEIEKNLLSLDGEYVSIFLDSHLSRARYQTDQIITLNLLYYPTKMAYI